MVEHLIVTLYSIFYSRILGIKLLGFSILNKTKKSVLNVHDIKHFMQQNKIKYKITSNLYKINLNCGFSIFFINRFKKTEKKNCCITTYNFFSGK